MTDFLDLDTIEARAAKVANFTTKDADPFGAALIAVDSAEDVPALLAEVRRLRMALEEEQKRDGGLRIADALAEMDASVYGDIEIPFRMRAHLDPDREHGPFGVGVTRVPIR